MRRSGFPILDLYVNLDALRRVDAIVQDHWHGLLDAATGLLMSILEANESSLSRWRLGPVAQNPSATLSPSSSVPVHIRRIDQSPCSVHKDSSHRTLYATDYIGRMLCLSCVLLPYLWSCCRPARSSVVCDQSRWMLDCTDDVSAVLDCGGVTSGCCSRSCRNVA